MKKGISLAVLVVTIIVLVILTAATIATITGENGVIDEARTAVNDSKQAQAKEYVEMEMSAIQIKATRAKQNIYEYLTDTTEGATRRENLGEKGIIVDTTETNLVKCTYNGYEMSYDQNGILKNISTSSVETEEKEQEQEKETYSINVNKENAEALDSNDDTITEGETVILTYYFEGETYKCPTVVTEVTGATGVWEKISDTEGTMTLSNANGDVSFSIIVYPSIYYYSEGGTTLFANGLGTKASPFIVANAQHLASIKNLEGIYYVKLTNDIDGYDIDEIIVPSEIYVNGNNRTINNGNIINIYSYANINGIACTNIQELNIYGESTLEECNFNNFSEINLYGESTYEDITFSNTVVNINGESIYDNVTFSNCVVNINSGAALYNCNFDPGTIVHFNCTGPSQYCTLNGVIYFSSIAQYEKVMNSNNHNISSYGVYYVNGEKMN